MALVEDDLVGALIDGRWKVIDLLGEGGMGIVYLGMQVSLQREVAIKVLRSERGSSDASRARFRTEAEIVSQLEHPNTLKVLDFGELPDGRPYLVSERLRGHSLEDEMKRGRLPWRRTLRILRSVCSSLAEAHSLGVVHRDLKPSNVFLAEAGGEETVKVLDFGIAKVEQEPDEPGLTREGFTVGTPEFMSPEQARSAALDGRSDLYSIGVVAYACLTGRLPYDEAPEDPLAGPLYGTPKPLALLSPPVEVPDRIERLVMGLLSKAPEDRPASAQLLLETIDLILAEPSPASAAPPSAEEESSTRTSPVPIPTPAPAPPMPKRTPWVPAAGAAGALVIAAGALFAYLGQEPEVEVSRGPGVLKVSMLPKEDRALRQRAKRLEPALLDCYRASGTKGALRLRFLVDGQQIQVTVRPKEATAFRQCVLELAPSFVGDEPGLTVVEITLGPT